MRQNECTISVSNREQGQNQWEQQPLANTWKARQAYLILALILSQPLSNNSRDFLTLMQFIYLVYPATDLPSVYPVSLLINLCL